MSRRGLLLAIVMTILCAACASGPDPNDPARLALMKATYDDLHARLEKAAANEPLVASAFKDRGQVVLAIRSELIKEISGTLAQRYLDNVTVDLKDVTGHSSGEVIKDTFLGHITLGEWRVRVDLGDLVGRLRAGTPRVGLRAPDLIDVDLPVDVQDAIGGAALHFNWDSKALANVICKDFEIAQRIRGRILAQRHRLKGALRLHNTGENVTATPLFPDRRIHLRMDLTPQSWDLVEAALRSQNSFGKCGMLIKPDQGVGFLRQLAARGITVRLPRSIFRTVSLPASFKKSVEVNDRKVYLRLKAESLRIEPLTLWSSASVRVQPSVPTTP